MAHSLSATQPNGLLTWLSDHWWKLLLGAVGVGASWALLNVQVNAKADKSDVLEMRRDISDIKHAVDDMNARQRAFFCRDQPPWCR